MKNQAELIAQLSISQTQNSEMTDNKPPAGANQLDTLLIGDSILKDIHEKGLQNTKVECKRGAKIASIKDHLNSSLRDNKYKVVIIHGGTNDCTTNDREADDAAKTYEEMISEVKSRAPETKVIISTVCPRIDKAEHQERVDQLNLKLKTIGRNLNCAVVDNDLNFKSLSEVL